MVTSIVTIALFVGLALGAILLVIVSLTYYKQKRFGLGGALLSFFGVVLLGLSIWSEVEFSFGRIKFHAMRERLSELATIVDSTMQEIEHLSADQDTLMLHVAKVQNTTNVLFANNVPSHVQADITKIVERDSIMRAKYDRIDKRRDAIQARLRSLLNAQEVVPKKEIPAAD
jgi:hypothetical protein